MALKGTATVIVGVSTIVPWSTLAGLGPVLHTVAAVVPSVVIATGAAVVIVQVETLASPASEQTFGVDVQSVIVSPVSEAVPVLDSVLLALLAPVNVDKVRETLQPWGAPPLASTAVIGNVVLPVPGSVILIEGGGAVVTDNPPEVTMAVTVSHAVDVVGEEQAAANARPAPLKAKRAISNRPMDSPTRGLVGFVLLME